MKPKQTKQLLTKCTENSSGLDSVVFSLVKRKGLSFSDNDIHILDMEDKWFERPSDGSLNKLGGLRLHLIPTYNAVISSLPRRLNNTPYLAS